MFMKHWKQEIFTIPNLLSLFRLALIPVYVDLYLQARETVQFYLAGLVLTVSCLTDLADGWIARRFHMVSTLGKILDPLADKVTQFALILCLSSRYAVLKPVLILLVVKELFQLTLGIIHLTQGKMLPGALAAGKISTAILFFSLTALVLFPTLHPAAVSAIALTDSFFLGISFVSYILAYFGKHSRLEDLNPE